MPATLPTPVGIPPLTSRAWQVALTGLCIAASVLFWLYFNGIGPDDAWITYRYAENIAAGRGFVFNAGERVYGTSTPLYALILAVARRTGLPIPQTSWVIGFVSMNASIVMLFLLVRRIHTDVAALAAAGLLASAYLFHRVATFGMETPLYTAAIIATFLAYARQRDVLAAALAAMCVLIRLDGAAVGAALAVAHVLTRRQIPWKAGLVYGVIVAPWLIFAVEYFGSVLPNTMVAKQLHTGHTRLYWMPLWLLFEPRAWLALAGAAATVSAPEMRARGGPIGTWALLYAGAYSLVPMHRYDWYLTPLLPALAMFAGIGVVVIGTRLAWTATSRVALPLALALALSVVDAAHAGWRLLGNEGILALERTRYEAAVWMRDNLPAAAPIATGGIGLVGYFTGRHIYDAMGLVTPGSMRIIGPLGNPRDVPFPRFLPAIIEDYRPEYVFDAFWLPANQEMPDFMIGRYEVLREWRHSNPGWPVFMLYHRIQPTSTTASIP